MNTIIDLHFTNATGKNWGLMRRTISTDFVPILNASLEDNAWKQPKRINDIFINPSHNYYLLIVDNEIVESIESFNEIVKAYEFHGWEKIY
jgi:hypothetical protein